MLITIDTSNVTDADRAILALVLEGYDGKVIDGVGTAPGVRGNPDYVPGGQAKPKRARRTNLEIAFDTAKEAHDADPTELAALVTAAEELKAKDPGNERLKDFDPADFQPTPEAADESAPDAGAAFSPDDTADNAGKPEPAESITIEEVTELATKLIAADRPGMVDLLKQFGARKVSDVPESDWSKFASEIRAKLSA